MSFNCYLPDTAAELVELLGLIPHPEGGFFLETHRSGSEPMSSRGQTDFSVPSHCLVETTGRDDCRPDRSKFRNCLTSIYWVPTKKSPSLPLVENLSDHVHYYQGGLAFEYIIYNPKTATLRTVVLGPNLRAGQQLQVPVSSGEWKSGRLLDDDEWNEDGMQADYSIIAEAVGPGFDFHDFHFVTKRELEHSQPSEDSLRMLTGRLHPPANTSKPELDFDGHYDGDEKQQARTKDRM